MECLLGYVSRGVGVRRNAFWVMLVEGGRGIV